MKRLLLLILLSLITVSLKAQLATWDFTGPNAAVATLSATNSDPGLASVPVLTRGPGAAANAETNSFRTTGFQNNGIATTNTDFFQVTFKAAIGKKISLSTIDARLAGTASFAATPGVASQFAFSLDGTTFTLIGNSVTTIGTPATLSTISLSAITALQNVDESTTITLRYYASGQTTTGGWGFNSPSAGTIGFAIGGTIVDTTPPTFTANYPQTSNISTTAFTLTSNINEIGKTYYVILPDGATAPSAAQVKAGQDATNTTVSFAGNIANTAANTDFTANIIGLTQNTNYDVYAVAEDGTPNLQTTITKLDVKTLNVVTPVLSATPTTIDFNTQQINTASAEKTFVLNSADLNGTDVSLTTAAPFAISKTAGGTFGTALTYTAAELTGSNTVYTQFKPTATGTFNGSVAISGGGSATSPTVTLTGVGQESIITVDQTTLAFGNQATGTNSTAKTYNLSASNLTNDVKVTTTAPFAVSKDNVTFSTSINYTIAELATSKTVYVRFSPTALGAATADALNVSTDAATKTVNLTGTGITPPPAPVHVVIAEVYGGGGNTGSVYKNDFIELYNPSSTAVDLTGWSVQYASAAGTSWQVTTLSGSIAAKGFYLIQEAPGSGGTTDLPTPDKTGTISISGTNGKVLLANVNTAQTGPSPTGTQIIDFVGFGTAGTYEGTGAAPAPSNTNAIERKASSTSDATSLGDGGSEEFSGNGYDSDNNATDFVSKEANPQNSSVTEPESMSGPFLIVTPKSLAFGNQATNTVSASKTYVLSAGNLTNSTTLTVAAPFSISKDDVAYGTSLTYTTTDLAANQTIYVKFSPTSGGNATGSVLHTSTGANTVTLSLAGAGIDPNQTLFSFENCSTAGSSALSDGFYQYSVTGPQTWGCVTTFGHNGADATGTASTGNALQINGYSSGNILNEDWLISPALNLSNMTYAVLSFWTRSAFSGDKLQLKVSTNYAGTGNPNLATWTNIDGKFPETASDVWTKSGNIDLSAYKALPVYVAFVYNSTTTSASRWTLDDFAILNSTTPPPVDLTVANASLNFGFQAANTTSTEKTFDFSAGNLTGDVVVTAPANFTIANTSNGTYGTSLTYTKAAINNTSPTVYTKFSPTTANTSYASNVTIATQGSANKTVTLSGNTFDIASTLEVVNWNIEWFGSPEQDPSNDVQQAANVKTVVNNINADIYGFAEVVDTALFRSTVLPAGYNVIFSDFGSYANDKNDNGKIPGNSYNLTQKLAFMYRTDIIKPVQTFGVLRDTYYPALTNNATGSPFKNWSSGRFPFLMEAKVQLNGKEETIYFIELHAKANTGNIASQNDAYDRRKGGNKQLKDWIDANLAGKKVIILGDFNDVLNPDKTIAPKPAGTGTSYSDFTNDAANYFPITLPLSLAGKRSTAGFPTVIDNVIISKDLNTNYIPNTVEVLDAVKNLVTSYNTTTTDHYPIKSRYIFGNGAPTLAAITNRTVCYSSANQTVALTGITAGPETTQTTTLTVTSDNANLFDVLTVSGTGTTGTLTYHFKNNVAGSANVTVTVKDNGGTGFGGVDTFSQTFKITVNGLATATATGTTTVAQNATAPLITFTGANGIAPYTFTYNINGGANKTIATTTGNSVTVTAPTTTTGSFAYNLVNVADANCGQAQTGTATVTVRSLPVATIAATGAVCINGTSPVVTFTGSAGTAPYTFTYQVNGGANKTITTNTTTATLNAPTNVAGTFNYTLVSIADANGTQTQTGTATVTINAFPVINITSNNASAVVSKGTSVVLAATGGATGGATYIWSPSADILTGQSTATLTVRPKQTTIYTVMVTNASGCTSSQSITIQVADDYKIKPLNILSPNGDGKNDKFVIENIDLYPNNTLKIFDRSGRTVYTKIGYANEWDGTLNGSPLASDTYYYILNFGTGISEIKGYITLIRN